MFIILFHINRFCRDQRSRNLFFSRNRLWLVFLFSNNYHVGFRCSQYQTITVYKHLFYRNHFLKCVKYVLSTVPKATFVVQFVTCIYSTAGYPPQHLILNFVPSLMVSLEQMSWCPLSMSRKSLLQNKKIKKKKLYKNLILKTKHPFEAQERVTQKLKTTWYITSFYFQRSRNDYDLLWAVGGGIFGYQQ